MDVICAHSRERGPLEAFRSGKLGDCHTFPVDVIRDLLDASYRGLLAARLELVLLQYVEQRCIAVSRFLQRRPAPKLNYSGHLHQEC